MTSTPDQATTGFAGDLIASAEDRDLMAELAQGNQAALRALADRYGERIYRYALRLTGSQSTAEELSNDVLLEAWRSAHRFAGRSKLSTWLLGIARHRALNANRGKRGIIVSLDDDPTAGATIEAELVQDGSHNVMAHELDRPRLKKILTEALKNLSAEHRDVLELTFYHGCTYQEIAEIVGCPQATVRTRMHYAKQKLHKALRSSGEADAIGEAL